MKSNRICCLAKRCLWERVCVILHCGRHLVWGQEAWTVAAMCMLKCGSTNLKANSIAVLLAHVEYRWHDTARLHIALYSRSSVESTCLCLTWRHVTAVVVAHTGWWDHATLTDRQSADPRTADGGEALRSSLALSPHIFTFSRKMITYASFHGDIETWF